MLKMGVLTALKEALMLRDICITTLIFDSLESLFSAQPQFIQHWTQIDGHLLVSNVYFMLV